jgi:regulator of protease activity HflC (stomatin/prohibitin superfamily)
MTGTDWAYVPSAPPGPTYLDTVVDAPTPEARGDRVAELGALLHALDDRACFSATADNLVRSDDGWSVARPLLDEVQPLDRTASCARVAWHLAWALLQAGALDPEHPDRTVDDHAVALGGLAGLGIGPHDVERFRYHEATSHASLREFDRDVLERDMRAMGTLTMRHAAAGERLGARASARALSSAYDSLAGAIRDRDAAEAAAVDAAASRALAQSLGEVLERDEWIRARLRTVKATKPAQALISARKRILGRPE